MAHILAVMCSPKKQGFTASLYREAIEGMRTEPDVEIEEVFLPSFEFKTCRACYTCIQRSDHTCVLDDAFGRDGQGELYRKILETNGIFIANPTYMWGPNALCHLFFERCYPFLWSETLNGTPFASASSAMNHGMHRLANVEICKWAFCYEMRYIRGLPVHSAEFHRKREDLHDLGRSLARAALDDERNGRNTFTDEERFLYYMDKPWSVLEPYIDNLTDGSFRFEDALMERGLREEIFQDAEAIEQFRESAAAFRDVMQSYEAGDPTEATRRLARVTSVWKTATILEWRHRDREIGRQGDKETRG